MTSLANEFISAILQLTLFTLIPFIFFLFRKDKGVRFSTYIGFYKPTTISVVYSVFTVVILIIGAVGLIYIDEDVRKMVFDPNSVSGKLRIMGLSVESVVILLLTAVIKTSLAEEIFFRGFVANRLIHSLGFTTGNILQALFFGSIHLLLFWKLVGVVPLPLIFIFVFSTFGGLAIGYIKDKFANGSIVPGWIAHGLANVSSYSIIAFLL